MTKPFIHPNAICETTAIGARTRIWAFSHILAGATIGEDCNICDGVFIENDVRVGHRVTVKCGVQLWDGVTLEDDVFVGPNATFTNDPFPRSKVRLPAFARTIVRRGASIGANATILPGLEIGANAMVGAGAVVVRSVPPNAMVIGNPAQISGYVNAAPAVAGIPTVDRPAEVGRAPVGVGAAEIHQLRVVRDMRGDISVAEFEREIPFAPKRYFMVFDVPSREVRGEHAHKACHQFLICVRGSCRVLLDDGTNRREFTLDRLDMGIYMPPMIWGTQYHYSADAILLVFASHAYDADDYIRSYDEFLKAVVE